MYVIVKLLRNITESDAISYHGQIGFKQTYKLNKKCRMTRNYHVGFVRCLK